MPIIVGRYIRSSAVVGGVLTATLAVAACGSGSSAVTRGPAPASPRASASSTEPPLRGCVPACVRQLTRPGRLPAGTYQTKVFFGSRLSITVDAGWHSDEDSSGEFSVLRGFDGIYFWEDVYPVKAGKAVGGVPETTRGLLRWFRSSSQLSLGPVTAGHLGTLPATVVDVSLAPHARNEDPGCPVNVCALFLGFPQWDDLWGIAGTQVQRFYLSDVTYGGRQHLFVAVVYPDDAADLESFSRRATPLVDSVRVPVDAA